MRSAVGFALGMVAVTSLACSNTTNPVADSPIERTVTQLPGAIPFLTNVHTAALPAFNNPSVITPKAFNDLGEIVGDSINTNGFFSHTIFKWKADYGFSFLQVPTSPLGATNASAVTVNDQGKVAFQLQTLAGPEGQILQAATWDWQGNVTTLRSLGGGFNCEPKGYNNLGVMLGVCYDTAAGSNTYPTVWTPFGTPDALYVGGGGSPIVGTAYAISDAGYISGQTGNSTGFIFTPTKQENSLAPARASYPFGVNDSGAVAGMVFDTTRLEFEPAIWTSSGTFDHVYPSPGIMSDMSDDNIAVGGVSDTTIGIQVPVIWTAANGLQRLPGLEHSNLLSKEPGSAMAINKVHQILGYVILTTGQVVYVMWSLPDTPMLQAQMKARYSMDATADRSR